MDHGAKPRRRALLLHTGCLRAALPGFKVACALACSAPRFVQVWGSAAAGAADADAATVPAPLDPPRALLTTPHAGSGVPDPATGMAGPAADWLPELPIGLDGTQLPRDGAAHPSSLLPDLFVDPLLGSQTGLQLPLPVHPADAFMPPLHADSSGAGASGSGDSQSPSHGNSAPAAAIPAAAVTAVTSGQRRKAGGGGGKAKELTEEQKERIKAKNRRCVPVGMFVGMLLGCGTDRRGGECLLRFHSGSCLSQLSCRCS